jgi:hypothetical protein
MEFLFAQQIEKHDQLLKTTTTQKMVLLYAENAVGCDNCDDSMPPYARAAASADSKAWQFLALDCVTSAKWLGNLCGKYIESFGGKKFPVLMEVDSKGNAVAMISQGRVLTDEDLKLVYPDAADDVGDEL